ncbi:hypothetical protein QBC32DRAFT_253555 [Pseudoneurospora amorphoporcata]|uniref:Zn(2)-C6 fungal-type domain-containing protein n=1 Tax=Pseudoneurospora amorphoporcata TaxID=241081 RepID=A0AAN6P456_9PEZI|nr:hypothetical protein QBC32DRAFT_253555 [Pseudoneurospora amorphoporcata]
MQQQIEMGYHRAKGTRETMTITGPRPDPSGTSSSTPRPAQSGRKGSKKVRTGCLTCKIRKVKCDEAKPLCVRCTKTGRRCDGYLDAKTMVSRRPRRSGGVSQTGANNPRGSLSVFYEWASSDEKRSFHFFREVTAPCLSGDFDGAFWRVLVLQICESEPAVKHAVLAVSSLHEVMVRSAVAPYVDITDKQSFALFQYNKAISCLLDRMPDVDSRPLVPLLTCILFVFLEFMQVKDVESLIHLNQGHQILSELEQKPSLRGNPEFAIIRDYIVPMYTRISLTLLMIGGDPTAIPVPLKTSIVVPMTFETIDQVRYALHDFMEECLRFTKKSKPAKYQQVSPEELRALEGEQDLLMRKLSRFNVAFSLFLSRNQKLLPPGCVDLIEIHTKTIHIWISTALSTNETAFDDHISFFSAIIPRAAAFMETRSNPMARQNQTTKAGTITATGTTASPTDARRFSAMFTFETHVIAPLFFVAIKCRHPEVRRAALDLLRRNPARRENVWRADIMASIADYTIKLEERHLHSPHSDYAPSQHTSPPDTTDSSFSYPLAPGEMWSSELQDTPFGYNDHDGTATIVSSSGSGSGSVGSGTCDLAQLNPSMSPHDLPVDPSLLRAEDQHSVHSLSGCSYSAASSYDMDTTEPSGTMYMDVDVNNSPVTVPMTLSSAITATTLTATVPATSPAWTTTTGTYSTPSIFLEPPTPLVQNQQQQQHQMNWNPIPTTNAHHSYPTSQSHSQSRHSRKQSSGISFSPSHSPPGAQTQQRMRSPDAPYDVPEHFRVHTAALMSDCGDGKEEATGSRRRSSSKVVLLRKLRGFGSEWDVQMEYLAVS